MLLLPNTALPKAAHMREERARGSMPAPQKAGGRGRWLRLGSGVGEGSARGGGGRGDLKHCSFVDLLHSRRNNYATGSCRDIHRNGKAIVPEVSTTSTIVYTKIEN